MRFHEIPAADLRGGKRRRHEEDDTQINLVKHIELRAAPGVVWYLIRNHGKRSRAAFGRDKAMGLRNGAGDLGFVLPPNGQAAFLELKVGKNTATADQEKFGEDVTAAGAYYAVAWGLDDALKILTIWGVLRPEL